MCGIFGIVSSKNINLKSIKLLARHAQQRGRDSSGCLTFENDQYHITRADYDIMHLIGRIKPINKKLFIGHSRLITNGLSDNQPVLRDNVCVFHNGIIVNDEEIWPKLKQERALEIDTEIIAAITNECIESNLEAPDIIKKILDLCKGVISCALVLPDQGKLCLFSNNGSLYVGNKNVDVVFASEMYPLIESNCENIHQVKNVEIFEIPVCKNIYAENITNRKTNIIPKLTFSNVEEKLLEYKNIDIRRCSKCILPETMPFIHFDSDGVCNYCKNYKPRNIPKPIEELHDLVKPYRRRMANDCIVPFSGGRDSCYALHLVVNELKMKPIAYTYDWGMVTDLGRRNISRMCSKLGVENIIVAADITKKRLNIRKNIEAWLKCPHLGMISIFTAGDKHFFKYIERIKSQTNIQLNLWGVNPLEVTHFKAGFLGIPPYFEEKRVYTHGIIKQARYHSKRFRAMLNSPSYFNFSLWDTLSGEYYRSFTEKKHYYHIFDYWKWNEKLIEDVLDSYDWERAPDTNATWRIGDGTAAFYNYIYYTVAGFTEHDTFRSNQIREGDLERDEALRLVKQENYPRYPNIKWYLDAVGLDFREVVNVINSIPKLYYNNGKSM